MASGDRIELLTAGTFETAMDAQEEILNNISTKVNTINTNVEQSLRDISTAYTNVSKDISTVYQTETTNYSVLSDLSTKIGSSNNTGGTTTAGTVMAKLNNLITNVASIKSTVGDSSLNSTVFIPSTKVLKTVLNTTVTVSGRNTAILGCFVPKYSGTIRVDITGYSNTSSDYALVGMYFNVSSSLVAIYPTMPVTQSESLSMQCEESVTISVATTSSTTTSRYVRVKAGDIIYFATSKTSSNTTIVCSNIKIYGEAVSTY